METVLLRAESRPRGTKGSVNALRREGLLPAVVYGKDVGNLLVQLLEKDLAALLARHSMGSTLISLEVTDGESRQNSPYMVMIRDVQRDPIKQKFLHADFYQVSLTEEIQTEIPVILIGEAPGVKEGGILQHQLREVIVICLPTKLPDRLEADISSLGIGDQVTVADLQVPEGVKVVTDMDITIANVIAPVIEVEEEEEEEAEAAEGQAETAQEPGEA